MKPHLAPIIKPTVDCNLGCSYCYEGENAYKSSFMDDSTLFNVIRNFLEYNGEERPTKFIWHGGESLLMGQGFFEKVIEMQKSFTKYKIYNGIQTNGTLVTNDFAEFASRNDITIGLSIDGPQPLNDSQRKYRDGAGSHDDIMRGIHCIQNKAGNGKKTEVIAVVTKNTIQDVHGFYQFFAENGLSVRLNPMFYEGSGQRTRKELGVTYQDFTDVLLRIFRKWFWEEMPVIDVNPLAEMMENLMYGNPRGCVFVDQCYAEIIEVTPNGDVYPCTGAATKKFRMGNINKDKVEEMMKAESLNLMAEKRASALKKCSGCRYISICNAGCIRKSYMRRRRLDDKDYYCKAYQAVYAELENALVDTLGNSYRFMSTSEDLDSANPILHRIFSRRKQTKINGESCRGYIWRQYSDGPPECY